MSKNMRILMVAAAIPMTGLTAADRVLGALVPITNPGFESVQIGSGYSNNALNHPGWTRVGTPGAFTGVANPPAGDATLSGQVIAGFGNPTEGDQYGWTVNGFGFQQTITSVPFDASENYLLSVDAALSSDSDPTNANVGYTITFHLETGILLGQLEFSSGEDSIKDGVFRTRTINYIGGTLSNGTDGLDMIIRLQSANFGGPVTRYGAAFDNIRLEINPVPEPSAMALVATAFGLLARRRKCA